MTVQTASRPVLLLALLVAVMTLITCLPGLSAICDDYYYYERIARNILLGHGSTFDGVVTTNGYQPLWMVFVVFAVGVEHATHAPAYMVTIGLGSAIASAAVLLLGRDLSRDDLFAATCLVGFSAYAIFLAVLGMEVTLVLLFGSLYFSRLKASGYVGGYACGLYLALCFLARIDSPVYFLPGMVYVLWRSPPGARIRFLVPLSLTTVAYCVFNDLAYGVPVPISGMAKSVTRLSSLHAATWAPLISGAQSQLMLVATLFLTTWAMLAGSRQQRIIALLSFAGVLAFFATTSLRSDWMIWPWYEYPLAMHLAQLVSFKAIPRLPRFARSSAAISVAAAALSFVLVVPRNVHEAGRNRAMVSAALRLRALFAAQPMAVLAMGDRAGAVGEYLPNRLVQLEGLVMDQRFLRTMRSANSILPVLKEYGVDYYVATNPRSDGNGCFTTVEPAQSKGDSHRIETTLCRAATSEFWIDGWHTVVFRIS